MVKSNIVPHNEVTDWIALYFRRKRLISLGINEEVDEFDKEVLLFIDSQIDYYKDKFKK